MPRPPWAIMAAPACRARSTCPLSDTVFFRVAMNSENQKGYIANFFKDPTTGRTNTQPAFGSKKLAAVLSLKWQPDETFSFVLRGDIGGRA